MKTKLFLFSLLPFFFCNFLLAQEPLIYEDVVNVKDSASSEELYLRAKKWFAVTYNDAQKVIQLDDRESGVIMGKALIQFNPTVFSGSGLTKGTIDYTIKIEFRDGRYRYTITDFIHKAKSDWGLITTSEQSPIKHQTQRWSDNVWNDIKNTISMRMNELINSLKSSMEIGDSDDDW